MNNPLTSFTGIATVTEHDGKPVIISAGDLETLKAYLGAQNETGYTECCQVLITVGKRAEIEIPSMAGFMAAQDFANKINGREMGEEITKDEDKEARSKGLVVVFGWSDDCTEFRGVINDEVGTGLIQITAKGRILFAEVLETLEELVAEGTIDKEDLPKFKTITANHGKTGWVFETDIPHAEFKVVEDGEHFGTGIVFHISDLKN